MNNPSQKQLKAQAKSFFNKKDFINANRIYTHLCRETPDAECYYMLSVIYGYSSNHILSEQHAKQALHINPEHSPAFNQLGIAQAAQGKYAAAIISFNRSLVNDPKNTQSLNNLGNLYREIGDYAGAEACYKKSLKFDRKNYITINNIANIYLSQGQYDKAESYYKKAIKLNKKYFDAYYNLGITYQNKGNHREALKYYKLAQKTRPGDVNPQAAIANSYEKQGKLDKALEFINPLIAKNIITPDIAEIYSRICIKNKNYGDGIDIINKCLTQHINPIQKQNLLFNLGDILDKQGSYPDAFKQYSAANTMRPYQYDRTNIEREFAHIKNIFSDADARQTLVSDNQSRTPIFIVGMPRSATSLIEQILSSHSKVSGAGELSYLGELEKRGFSENKSLIYPDYISQLTLELLNQLSDKYLSKLERHSTGKCLRITDKMPHNFLRIGLIRRLFPNSKVIHCLRDPLDVCLSIYFHNFNQNHPYTDSLANLGHYYNQYRDLMSFWHNQYDNLILDVSYEKLLSNPEENVRAILQHAGLEWEDDCLKFYENKRTVSTPSYAQVTQPLYKTSMKRWQNYTSFIEELKNTIDDKYLDLSL